jgi:hypothetical protein
MSNLEQFELIGLVRRHALNDWGDLDEHDSAMNEAALTSEDRILSCYTVRDRNIYVITEWTDELGSPITTVLLAEEY